MCLHFCRLNGGGLSLKIVSHVAPTRDKKVDSGRHFSLYQVVKRVGCAVIPQSLRRFVVVLFWVFFGGFGECNSNGMPVWRVRRNSTGGAGGGGVLVGVLAIIHAKVTDYRPCIPTMPGRRVMPGFRRPVYYQQRNTTRRRGGGGVGGIIMLYEECWC